MKSTLTAKMAPALALAVSLASCTSNDSGPLVFAFSTAPVSSFVRVDRMGQPAIATALLSRDPAVTVVDAGGAPVNPGNAANPFNDQRDQFNRGDPANDARDFAAALTVGPQPNSLRNFHYEVGPQLRALGLTPCSTETTSPPASNAQVDISVCVAQAAPAILPDVITFNFAAAAGWPNGRHFDDPVIDRLLAVALLRISGAGAPHNINTLVGVINPTTDDTGTPSPATFPHLRPPFP